MQSVSVLGLIEHFRKLRDDSDRAIRVLLAYGRECIEPRPYRLADLAAAAGMSMSGVRIAYDNDDIEAARALTASPADLLREGTSSVAAGWDVYQTVIEAGRKYELPVPTSIASDQIYVNSVADVLAWARAFGAVATVYDTGSLGPADQIQAHAQLPRLGLGMTFGVLGSSPCDLAGTDHDHMVCVEALQVQALS